MTLFSFNHLTTCLTPWPLWWWGDAHFTQPTGAHLTLFQVRMGCGWPWALQGIWTSWPDSTVRSLGAFVKTGVTEWVKTYTHTCACVNDYYTQLYTQHSYTQLQHTWNSGTCLSVLQSCIRSQNVHTLTVFVLHCSCYFSFLYYRAAKH